MQLPKALLNSLESVNGFDKDAFIHVHESGERVTSIRINPLKLPDVRRQRSDDPGFDFSRLTFHNKIPWTDHGYYLDNRPSFTFDPLFHAGCYYVQEASSMFLEQALKQTVDLSQPLRVLDLCAAPGGKSTHLLSLISNDSLLVSNEVIRSRANILNDNIVKWGYSNVVVTNNDPKEFQRLKNYFDVIIIDAPCSGSGLFRREPEAIDEWSEQNVMLCSQRQQRILADVLPALKPGGVLIYSTCSYSVAEDEEIVQWLERELEPDSYRVKSRWLSGQKLKVKNEWAIVESNNSYRFWPDKIKGEGFFIACFRKEDGESEETSLPKAKAGKLSNKEIAILENSVNTEGLSFFRFGEIIHAISAQLFADMRFLSERLRIVNAGIRVGEIIKDKLIPDHAFALSTILSKNISGIELTYDDAIRYLKKNEMGLQTDKRGWYPVTFAGHRMGWVNILPNRINNYYPKALRILKD